MAEQAIAVPWLRRDTQWALDLMERLQAVWQRRDNHSQKLYWVGQLVNAEYPLNPLFKLGRLGQFLAWLAGRWNPAPVNLDGIYSDYERLQESRRYMRDGIVAHVKAVREDLDAATLLEVGCGQGNLLLELAPHFEWVTGVDLYEPFLDQARRAAEQQEMRHVDLQHGDGRNLQNISDGYADITLSVLAAHYCNIGEMVQLIRELLRTSRKAVVLMEMKYRQINAVLAFLKTFPLWTPFSWRFCRHSAGVMTKSPTENRLRMAIDLANADGGYRVATDIETVAGIIPYYLVTVTKQ